MKRGNLADHLMEIGYVRIELEETKTGQLRVPVRINDTPASLILDSGASGTVIDVAFAKDLGLDARVAGDGGAGAGGRLDTFTADVEELGFADLSLGARSVSVMDFRHVNDQLVALGETRPDGVLGADVLAQRAAVIEYEGPSLYLKATDADGG